MRLNNNDGTDTLNFLRILVVLFHLLDWALMKGVSLFLLLDTNNQGNKKTFKCKQTLLTV